jgi:hypothetical protein
MASAGKKRRVYQNATIFVPDLARQGVIVTATFENCVLRGPAVVGILGSVSAKNVVFGIEHDDLESILWEVPEGAFKIGGIGFQDCRLSGGRTEGIGFMGTKEQLEIIRGSITPPDKSRRP